MSTPAKAPTISAPTAAAPPAAAPPAAPSASFTDTPEFKAAVAESVTALLPELVKQIKQADTNPDTSELFSKMALAIAEISDQGTQRKRVAPEILAQREAAWKRMVALIQDARANNLRPEYRAVAKLYLNERLIEPFTQDPSTKLPVAVTFTWTGEPNDGMRPVNDIAKKIYAEFRASRGSVESIAKEDARPYWMTPAGLVVKGDPPPRREMQASTAPDFVDDLSVSDAEESVPNQNDPNAPFIHVLGTVAAPAMQNYQGKQV